MRALMPTMITALAALFMAAGHAGEPDCLDWSKAGSVIAQNSLLPANVIYDKVQKRMGGKIVNQPFAKPAAASFISSWCSAPRAR